MLRHTSGVICVAITDERADELTLPLMVPENTESQRTAFTVSVDLRHGTTTGISAADRSAAIRALARPEVGASSSSDPGTCFRCGHGPAACSSVADIPSRPSI